MYLQYLRRTSVTAFLALASLAVAMPISASAKPDGPPPPCSSGTTDEHGCCDTGFTDGHGRIVLECGV